jgi:hypothetical protein
MERSLDKLEILEKKYPSPKRGMIPLINPKNPIVKENLVGIEREQK